MKTHDTKTLSLDECVLNIERLENDLIGYLKYMTKDATLAMDLAQESMIKAMPVISSARKLERIKPYIIKIARNLAIDHYRRKETSNISIDDADHAPAEGTSYDCPEQLTIKKQERELVFRTFSSLDNAQREIITLYYYNDMSLKQIAEVLYIPLNTAITRLSRARKKLKSKLIGGRGQ